MSDPSAPSTAWPAARPTGISPIQHPAWEAARNAILDLASEGPVTAVIVGQSGTGKTWLLRELASALGDHGFPTMMLMQGNLPMTLSNGAALLVDDASLMTADTRAQMSAQQHGVVVLAGAEWVEDPVGPNPVIIPLRALEPDEIADFADKWLQKSGLPDSIIGARMLSRVASQSGGRVATIVQMLGEAGTARHDAPPIVDQDPLPEIVPDAVAEPPIARASPRRRAIYRPILTLSAIAAMIALGWALMPVPPPAKIAQAPAPPSTVADAAPPLPPLRPAETPDPAQTSLAAPAQTNLADAVAPVALPSAAAAPVPVPPLRHAETPDPALVTAAPPPVALPPPGLDAANAPLDLPPTAPFPAVAAAPPPPVLIPSEPTVVATLEAPSLAARPAPPKQSLLDQAGGPGLILIAQRGDTLQSLYGSVYRDRKAPPFATVMAANPRPFKAGAIVVFPEPPGGWKRLQR